MEAKKGRVKREPTVFGRVMKAARKKAGYTRNEYSEIVGHDPRYIAALENEGQKPGYETICKVITSLGIDPNLIFYPDGPRLDDEAERVIRLVRQLDENELSVVAATAETLLNVRSYKKN